MYPLFEIHFSRRCHETIATTVSITTHLCVGSPQTLQMVSKVYRRGVNGSLPVILHIVMLLMSRFKEGQDPLGMQDAGVETISMTRNRTNNGSTRRNLVNNSSNIVPMTSGSTRNRPNRPEMEDAGEVEDEGAANRGTISNFFNTFIRQQQQQQTLLSQFQQFNSIQQQLPQNQRAFLPLTITNTNGRLGGSNNNGNSITIAQTANNASSTLRNKIVYALQCAYCQITVCRRAMKAILLADTKIELYSTDIPPTP